MTLKMHSKMFLKAQLLWVKVDECWSTIKENNLPMSKYRIIHINPDRIQYLFCSRYGETTMHIAKECFSSFLVAYATPKNSLYKAALDKKISLMIEAGLPDKYYNDEMEKVARLARAKISDAIAKPLTLYHLQAPLYLLPILLGLALLSFLIEISVGGIKRGKF